MSYWPWLMTLLLLLSSAALIAASLKRASGTGGSTQRHFDDLLKVGLEAGSADNGWIIQAIARMGQRPALRWMTTSGQDELVMLLRQAGWTGGFKGTLFHLFIWVTPLMGALGAGLYVFTAGNTGMQVVTPVFIGFTLGFLAPRRWLRIAAARRRQTIAQEMPVAIHMLRMVFDAGLSTEHALRVLHDEGRVLMPNLAEELKVALQRINAGQDRADALEDMAAPLDVPDLTGTVAILKQVTRYGGSIRDSLMKFAHLIEEQQQTAVREQVGKLSTKMTVVMVVFLFPALMIFLAGPGFLALGRALMGVNG